MKTKLEEKYEAPLVVILQVEVERGFAVSDGLNGPELEDGEIFD